MTRPTLPGLVAEWTKSGESCLDEYGYGRGYSDAEQQCAAELSQAVALTPEEAEAIAELNVALGHKQYGPERKYWNTLRALVTRLTAASDGGGKGETK